MTGGREKQPPSVKRGYSFREPMQGTEWAKASNASGTQPWLGFDNAGLRTSITCEISRRPLVSLVLLEYGNRPYVYEWPVLQCRPAIDPPMTLHLSSLQRALGQTIMAIRVSTCLVSRRRHHQPSMPPCPLGQALAPAGLAKLAKLASRAWRLAKPWPAATANPQMTG